MVLMSCGCVRYHWYRNRVDVGLPCCDDVTGFVKKKGCRVRFGDADVELHDGEVTYRGR